MTVRELIAALQAVPESVQDEAVFVIYNLEDGVQEVLNVAVEDHGNDGQIDLIRLRLEGEAGRGIV